MLTSTLKLCLVTHQTNQSLDSYRQFILRAVKSGVTSVQLRNKKDDPVAMHEMAVMLMNVLRPLKIPLIINDNVGLAKEIDADGVHLGQSDCSPVLARQILGNDKIIGLSIETMEELEQANRLTCINYIAASTVFPTETKTNCRTIWGLNGLSKIIMISKHPVVAIGGINIGNARDVMITGVIGVAVISAIHDHVHTELAVKQLVQAINRGAYVV